MTLKEHEELEDKPIFCGQRREDCHFELLKAVFSANVDVLLPLLYYASSDYPMRTILRDAERLHLNQKCLNTLLEGRESLENARMVLVTRTPERSFIAPEYSPCSSTNGICLEHVRFGGLDQFLGASTMRNLTGRCVALSCWTPLCEGCRTIIEELVDNRRKTIWDNVPSYFGFPAWDILRTQMEEYS